MERLPFPFVVDVSEADERCEGDAEAVVRTLALRKAHAVSPRHQGAVILSADTVVVKGGILNKPRDPADAARMLALLSGGWHRVFTGVAVLRGGCARVETAVTRVHFLPLSQAEIRRYVETGEPMDKAGAYGIQGPAGRFIDRIDGCFYNVMGLPLSLVYRMVTAALDG